MSARTTVLRRSLGTLSLVFILYFTTSGGPYTTETLVMAVGPAQALLILLLVPLLWSIPEILIVGELASMLPEEGGYYRWVQRAFGPFWAFQNGWLTWMYSLVDMAIYPVLFNQYLQWFAPGLSPHAQWFVSLAVIWGAAAINLRGSLRVGRTSVITGLFIVVGFLLVAIAGLAHATHLPWAMGGAPPQGASTGLSVGLSIALWNYIGWDNASTVQGEVRDATRNYPRALAFALPLVVLGYFLPLMGSLASTDWHRWTDGGWPEIAAAASGGRIGSVLAGWVAVGGMVSALSLFNALLLAYSRIPFVMAADGYLPPSLARTDSRGTPVVAVVSSAVLYSVFVLIPFGDLVVADVLLYSLALFLEFGALVRLRRSEPNLRGAFRIPLGRRGVMALAALPMVILTFVTALAIHDEHGFGPVLGSVIAIGLGGVAYWLADRFRAPRVAIEEAEAEAA